MPQIEISTEMYERIRGFKSVIEAILEEPQDIDECVDLILGQGLDEMLAGIIADADSATMLKSFQLLAAKHPLEVYGFVAETWIQGAATQQHEGIKRRLGFIIPSDSDSEMQ